MAESPAYLSVPCLQSISYGADVHRNFGLEHFCSRCVGDSAVLGDSSAETPPPTKVHCTLADAGRNTTGIVGAELLFLSPGAESPALRGGVSSLTTIHHRRRFTDKGRKFPGSSGVELLFHSPQGGVSGMARRRLRPPEDFQES